MNCKYLLFVKLKNNKIESYYADSINDLYEYAKFRKFANFGIYELKEIGKKVEHESKSKI